MKAIDAILNFLQWLGGPESIRLVIGIIIAAPTTIVTWWFFSPPVFIQILVFLMCTSLVLLIAWITSTSRQKEKEAQERNEELERTDRSHVERFRRLDFLHKCFIYRLYTDDSCELETEVRVMACKGVEDITYYEVIDEERDRISLRPWAKEFFSRHDELFGPIRDYDLNNYDFGDDED
jgi:membrane protein implicated in regulation of membrane protease activity